MTADGRDRTFRRNMNTHAPRTTIAALCALGAVALPATASAASGASVIGGPLKVKDYQMTVIGSDAAKDSLSIMFDRRAGKASQSHFYTFDSGVTVTPKRIKASLGQYGKIDMKLVGAGAAKRGKTPKGCTGSAGSVKSGTLKGTFKLVADSTYFKTVSTKTLKGSVARGGKLTCNGGGTGGQGGNGSGDTMLQSTLTGADGMLMFSAIKEGSGAVWQQATRMDDAATTAPASIMHLINAPGSGSAFSPAGDLSSATGTAVAPFFGGAFSFAGESMGSMATGALSGDLVAKFDSIGTQQIAAGSPDAMLMKR